MLVEGLERPARALVARREFSLAKHLDSSATTQQRLEAELVKRRTDYERIVGLDQKISVELASLRNKIEVYKRDMVEFANIPKLREKAAKGRSCATGWERLG